MASGSKKCEDFLEEVQYCEVDIIRTRPQSSALKMEFASDATTTSSFHLDMSLHTNQNIPFPWKLHEMLDTCEKEGLGRIVSWLPDNASFRVHNPTFFIQNVIQNFFKRTKYKVSCKAVAKNWTNEGKCVAYIYVFYFSSWYHHSIGFTSLVVSTTT